ncbi:flagellar basal-body rod protein FlgG [Lentibacillus halodurans]|uniref:Flagellar basal-body rod protein FlgG n=1 Tax=Lentibacillus halodurans TaxID=237679 RepID=A0A1I0ZR77_9BACI|nr:flagellar hook-basal body protein [Lentibacillus halodurans]SFB26858.1 flagellar basal-body rod protein FlgG [Lentibacillus halodurans]
MSRTMIQAAVTMNQLQNKLDVVGNNMANSQTTGYKTRQADFSSLLFQQIDNMTDPANGEGRLTPDGVRVGSGARLGSVNINLSPGAIQETDRALDTALLEKNHLFQIQVTENDMTETRYTRDGSFYLSPINDNQDVMLTTKDGYPVLGENGPIVIAEGFDEINIQPNGQISVQRGNVTENAGNLAITEAARPRLLETAGDNAFRLPDLDELGYDFAEMMQPVDPGTEVLRSGALEQSNVDLSQQMTDMMNTQRSYQFNARTISMSDQMMGLVNQLR